MKKQQTTTKKSTHTTKKAATTGKKTKTAPPKPVVAATENTIEFKLSIVFAAIALAANFGLVYAIQPVYEIIDNDNASNVTQTLDRSETLSTIFTVVSLVAIVLSIAFLAIGLVKHVKNKADVQPKS